MASGGDPDIKVSPPSAQPEEVSAFSGAHNRLPPFHKTNPVLWFAHAEAVFYTSKVTSQVMKYQATMANLGMDVLEQVADLIGKGNPETQYDDLKSRLIQVYGESETRRIQRLLQDTQLGNQRPSQLLRVMLQQAGTIVNKDVVRTLWLRNLPSRMQAILTATGEEDLEKLAVTADKIAEIDAPSEVLALSKAPHVQPSTSTAPQPTTLDQLAMELRSLRVEVAELRQAHRSRSSDRKPWNGNRRSRSRSSSRGGVCFYHHRFKDKAQKCTKPCNYKQNLNGAGR